MHAGVLINGCPLRPADLRRGWVCSRCQPKKICSASTFNLPTSVVRSLTWRSGPPPSCRSSLPQKNSVCQLPYSFRKEGVVPLSGVPASSVARYPADPRSVAPCGVIPASACGRFYTGLAVSSLRLFSPDILITLSTTSISDKLVAGQGPSSICSFAMVFEDTALRYMISIFFHITRTQSFRTSTQTHLAAQPKPSSSLLHAHASTPAHNSHKIRNSYHHKRPSTRRSAVFSSRTQRNPSLDR